MDTIREQRATPRHPEQDRVAVTILSAPLYFEMEGQTFFCLTRDISIQGLSFQVHLPLQKGALLKLSVALSDPVETFKHIGRVASCSGVKQELVVSYRIGVKLADRFAGHNPAWKKTIEKRMQRQLSRQAGSEEGMQALRTPLKEPSGKSRLALGWRQKY